MDSRARYQGYTFFFREGFCWNNVLTTYIKCRKKDKTVQSTEAMTFFSLTESAPEYFMICIMNSRIIAEYVDTFVNATSHCTTGDAKLIFVKIPTKEQLLKFKDIFDRAYKIKKQQFLEEISMEKADANLEILQEKLDKMVEDLYGV